MVAAIKKMSNKFLHFAQHIDFIRKKSCLTQLRTWNLAAIKPFLPLDRGKSVCPFELFVEACSVSVCPP